MGQFRAWVEDKRDGWIVRYQDGVTREPSGRFKRFTYDIVEKTQTMTLDGKVKTGKWLAEALADRVKQKHLMGELAICDVTLELEPLVARWLEECESAGLSDCTIRHYEISTRRFLEECPVRTLGQFLPQVFKDWRLAMVTAGLKNKTIRGRLVSVRVFSYWLAANDKIKKSPFEEVKEKNKGKAKMNSGLIPAEKRKEPQFYTREEFMKLDAALAEVCPQTRLGCNLAHDLGLRKVEFVGDGRGRLGALWEDIMWQKDGKADLVLRNEVVKGQEAGRTLRLTTTVLGLLGSRRSGPLLTITRSQFDHAFIKARQRAGIKATLDVHGLRDTFAMNYLQSGHDLASLKEQLGHHDIQSTMIYAKFERNFLAQAIEETHDKRMQDESILKSGGQLVGNLSEISAQWHTEPHKAARSISSGIDAENVQNNVLRR